VAVGTRWGECRVSEGLAIILIMIGIVVGVVVVHHDGYLVGKEHGYTEGRADAISKQQVSQSRGKDPRT